jgi:hypothetical protein
VIASMGISAAHYTAFITEIIKNDRVWTIYDDGGIPAPKNMDGERSMPLWSTIKRAQNIIENVPNYVGFRIKEIPLDDFISKWLPGLTNDGLFVGVNWSGKRATGYDLKPNEVQVTIKHEKQKHNL